MPALFVSEKVKLNSFQTDGSFGSVFSRSISFSNKKTASPGALMLIFAPAISYELRGSETFALIITSSPAIKSVFSISKES